MEDDTQASTYSEAQHYSAELNTRLATTLGRQVMEATAAGLRAEFAERKHAGLAERLAEVQAAHAAAVSSVTAEVEGMKDLSARAIAALDHVEPIHLPPWFRNGEPAPAPLPQDAQPIRQPPPVLDPPDITEPADLPPVLDPPPITEPAI